MLLTTPVPAMLSATPPTTSQRADVPLGWRVTPTCSASELSAESIKTVPKTQPVSPRDVSTLVDMKTPCAPSTTCSVELLNEHGCARDDICPNGEAFINRQCLDPCVTVAPEHDAL